MHDKLVACIYFCTAYQKVNIYLQISTTLKCVILTLTSGGSILWGFSYYSTLKPCVRDWISLSQAVRAHVDIIHTLSVLTLKSSTSYEVRLSGKCVYMYSKSVMVTDSTVSPFKMMAFRPRMGSAN